MSGRLRTPGVPPPAQGTTGRHAHAMTSKRRSGSYAWVLGLRNGTHTWARFGPNDISTCARTRSSPTPGNSIYAHGLTRALIRRSGGRTGEFKSRQPDSVLRPTGRSIEQIFDTPTQSAIRGSTRSFGAVGLLTRRAEVAADVPVCSNCAVCLSRIPG